MGQNSRTGLILAFTEISDPEQETEFNDWYDRYHAVATLRVPGVLSCRRFKLAPQQMSPSELPLFLTVYEVDADALDSLPGELVGRLSTGEIPFSELMNQGMAAFYEPLSEPRV
jgi:hypothetical protein